MKLSLALVLAFFMHGQAVKDNNSGKTSGAAEVRMKAVKLVELSGGRARFITAFPELMEQAKAAMQKQCPDCNPAFLTEWGKRMTARLNIEDFVNVAARVYERRFASEELTEFLAVLSSQRTDKPVALSTALQKKYSDLLPAIMGEITGGCTEIGAKLGGEIGAEIEKEHPEWVSPKPKSAKP